MVAGSGSSAKSRKRFPSFLQSDSWSAKESGQAKKKNKKQSKWRTFDSIESPIVNRLASTRRSGRTVRVCTDYKSLFIKTMSHSIGRQVLEYSLLFDRIESSSNLFWDSFVVSSSALAPMYVHGAELISHAIALRRTWHTHTNNGYRISWMNISMQPIGGDDCDERRAVRKYAVPMNDQNELNWHSRSSLARFTCSIRFHFCDENGRAK